MHKKAALVVATLLIAAACSTKEEPPSAERLPGPTPTVQRTPIGELPEPDIDAVLAHTKVLASDEFQGRAPGTKGEDLTVAYLVDQFKKIGLKPGNTDGTYVQKVPLVGITPTPAPLVIRARATRSNGSSGRTMSWRGRSMWRTARSLENSELVFVGYGVVAPEYNWDDYKGVDVKGKTLVMLVNDPPVPDPANAAELDPKTFGGRAMTYYGRWTYKYEIGAEKGAAGCADRPRDRAGRLPVQRRAVEGRPSSSTSSRRTRTWSRAGRRRMDHARQGAGSAAAGGPGFRHAEDAGGDARIQAGAARRDARR